MSNETPVFQRVYEVQAFALELGENTIEMDSSWQFAGVQDGRAYFAKTQVSDEERAYIEAQQANNPFAQMMAQARAADLGEEED